MKKKQIAIVMGIVLSAASLGTGSVYAAEPETEQNMEIQDNGQEEQDVVYGEVVSISEGSVTIKVGTMKTMDPGESSMLDLTGEEQEITITENTTVHKQGMGQPDGQGGPQGEAPEMPDGGTEEAPGKPDGEAPEKPEGENGEAPEKPDGENQEAPEKPDGEAPEMPEGENGEAPEKPEGENGEAPEMLNGGNQEAPEKPDGENETITWEDISEGDTIAVTLDDNGAAAAITVVSMEMGGGMGQPGDGMGQPGGSMAGQPESYDAQTEYTEDMSTDGETYTSTGTDENAVHVDGEASVTIKNADITRSSDDSTGGDSSSFYGVGAALLASSGTAYVSDSTIVTDVAGAAGLFAYGTGTVYVSDTTIATEKDTSGGIHAAGGGTLYAWDVIAETQGESSAAIRSDRGGGTMVVDGGTYTSNGSGSPAIYSTADIAVNNAELTANGSEAICIEGLNSIHLYDSKLTGNMSDDERNDCTWNVILYQSMSGDSEVGNSTFEMQGGTLTAENGGMFYTTNTESTITLSNVDITYADDSDFFLKCTGNANQRGWGQRGANGADCLFTAISQKMEGDVIWDSISNLDIYLTDGSILRGAFVDDETNAGTGGDGYCNVYISEDSTWLVTGDSTVSSLECAGTITDENGDTITIQGTDGTVYVEGTSKYTVTTDSYQDSAEISGASQTTAWGAYETEKPSELEK